MDNCDNSESFSLSLLQLILRILVIIVTVIVDQILNSCRSFFIFVFYSCNILLLSKSHQITSALRMYIIRENSWGKLLVHMSLSQTNEHCFISLFSINQTHWNMCENYQLIYSEEVSFLSNYHVIQSLF